jgi:hypothetical protein
VRRGNLLASSQSRDVVEDPRGFPRILRIKLAQHPSLDLIDAEKGSIFNAD